MLEQGVFLFILVGFFAQLIDGALGMAYGVSSNTVLLTLGVPPALASASVHMAEVFTTGVSGFSHWRLKNVDWHLIKRLMIPGVLGGITGAYLLTSIDGTIIKPYISTYLLVMGLIILWKAFHRNHEERKITTHLIPLGLIGGFFDAIGGGGWGPVVTTTLVARGNTPRYTIGSVNLSEFFVTFTESVTFLLTIGLGNWQIVLGLLIGGVIAAPLGAWAASRIPTRFLMSLVGVLIVILSIRTILLSLA